MSGPGTSVFSRARKPTYTQISTVVPSSTGAKDYAWLGDWPKVREWIGPRVVKNLAEHGYSIKNKEWETMVSVPRPRIDDDQHGIYTPMMEEMGRAVAAHPDDLIFDLLVKGLATNCYDGQYFFDTDHPVIDPETGAVPGERDPAQGIRIFRHGGARPPVEDMIAFIDDHRAAYGVEPICKVLPIAP